MNDIVSVFSKAFEEDPVGTSMLIDETVYNYMLDQAEQIAPLLESFHATVASEKIAVAKTALAKQYIEKAVSGEYPDDNMLQVAEWLRGAEIYAVNAVQKYDIAKSEIWHKDGREFVSNQKRGLDGRWIRSIDTKEKSGVLDKTPDKLSPRLRGGHVLVNPATGDRAWADSVTPEMQEQLKQHQYQWESASKYVRELYEKFSPSDRHDVKVVVGVLSNGKYNPQEFSLAGGRHGLPDLNIDPTEDKILSVSLAAETNDPEVQGKVSRFNMMGSITDSSKMAQVAAAMNRDQFRGAFGRRELSPEGNNKLSEFFSRLGSASNLLSVVGGDKLGRFAEFAGEFGPEASEVLGPYARQAAYRYRGTEKEPDLHLATDFRSYPMRVAQAAAAGNEKAVAALNSGSIPNKPGGKNEMDIVTGSARKWANATRDFGPLTEDEMMLNVRSDVAARHLLDTLPSDPLVAEVSRAAGNVLPSQGVVIDADGDVVSQSVGYADDHYLPFDLRNLMSLRGGQYVRTRVEGGLTAEDIYASVTAGARKSTVVSSSGVFSLEFDPNFRGARGNSDKARQMMDRYIKILDAVEGSNLYSQDISPAEKSRITGEVKRLYPGDERAQREEINRRIEDLRQEQMTITEDEANEIESSVRDEVESSAAYRGMSNQARSRLINDIYEERLDAAQRKKVQALRLNSDGYRVALETLQQQFPYFIRNVSYEPLNGEKGFLSTRGQSTVGGVRQRSNKIDRGYVQPGGMKAKDLKAGYYSVAKPPAPKSKVEAPEAGGATAPSPEDRPAQAPAQQKAAAPPMASVKTFNALSGPVISQKRKEMLAVLSNAYPSLYTGPMPSRGLDRDMSWDEVKSQGVVNQMKWLLQKDPSEYDSVFPANNPQQCDEVASLLSNKKAIRNFFAEDADKISERIDAVGMFGNPDITVDEAIEQFASIGRSIAEATYMLDPFEAPRTDLKSQFTAGNKPQAFKEIQSLATSKQVDEYASNNPAIAALAQEFLVTGGKVNNFSGIKDAASKTLKKYQDLASVADQYKSIIGERDLAAMATFKVAPQLKSRGLSYDEVVNMTSSSKYPVTDNPDTLMQWGLDSPVAQQEVQNVQRAWSLAMAKRLVTFSEGGDAVPKAEDVLLMKGVQGRSFRQVRILSPSDPVSKAVAMRRAANLPFLPKRISRS